MSWGHIDGATADDRGFFFWLFDTNGDAITGAAASITVALRRAGVKNAGAGTIDEIDAAAVPGLYRYDPTPAERVRGRVLFYVTHASQAPQTVVWIGYMGDDPTAPKPTETDIATAVETELADGAGFTALATQASVDALNNLDSAAVEAAAAAALAAYDPPTKAELDAAELDLSNMLTALGTLIGTIPTAAANAAEVRTALAVELARIDAAVSTRAATGANMALTPAERTAVAAAILTTEDGVDAITLQRMMRLVLAALTGPVSGASGGAGTLIFKNPAGTKDRITVPVDQHGNRAGAATVDLT